MVLGREQLEHRLDQSGVVVDPTSPAAERDHSFVIFRLASCRRQSPPPTAVSFALSGKAEGAGT